MRVYVGADYRGFDLKNQLGTFLVQNGYEVYDAGAYEYSEGDDFNDPAINVALNVRQNDGAMGILICDSAHGMTIQANRFLGIRAAHADSEESARLAREHDNANVLCLSAHSTNLSDMKAISLVFLKTKFEKLDRRVRRIARLDKDNGYNIFDKESSL